MELTNDTLILGVDLSLNSAGVCIINKHRTIIHAESICGYPLDGMARLNYIYERFQAIFSSYDINIIGFECQVNQQRFSYSAGSILPLAEAFGVFKLAVHQLSLIKNIEVYSFKPQILKQSLTGNGKADKEMMMEALGTRRLKHLKDNVVEHSVNDCADSYSAAEAALKVLENNFSLEYNKVL